jgi:methylmalonyl-CoA mutase cobalamin-binding subunit
MEGAVSEYAARRRSAEAWMLGRFILPASRLSEFLEAARAHLPETASAGPWALSALLGADVHQASALVASFNASHAGRAVVDTVELKASGKDEAAAALDALPAGLSAFVEAPLDGDLGSVLPLLRERGARAKVRTGGVVPEAIPAQTALARFIAACAEAGVAFKATAGLHHPIRSERALTYAKDSPRAVMHGFLNVFAAGAFARPRTSLADLEAVLAEENPNAFRLDDEALAWRHLRVPTDAIAAARKGFATSFGSCSFGEPVADLEALGILP